MFSRLGRPLVVAALVAFLGGHWAILQSVAWVNMVITFSRETTVAQAMALTFDGQHPCRLCRAIQEGKSKERQQQPSNLTPDPELKLNLPPRCFALVHPPTPGVAPERELGFSPRPEPPPKPPPRPA